MSTMTQTLAPVRSLPATRPRLVTGRFAAAMLADFGALTSFYLLLSVTPMYAVSAGAGSAGAGLVTGSLMLTTVLAEFASPRLLGRFGAGRAPRRGDRPGRSRGLRARDRGPAVRGLAGPERRVCRRRRDHGHQRAGPAGGDPL